MRKAGEFETRFQKISVWKSDLATEFRVAGAIHACMHRKRFLTGLAWDLIAAAALLHGNGKPKSILMLGVAGGTALRTLRQLLPDAKLTGVDLDGELIGLAKEEMFLSETGAHIEIADAYSWMKDNRRKFDVIIDDLYLAGEEDVFRAEECDGDWLSLVRKSLAPGGVLALNLVTGTGHRAKQTATRQRLAALFPTVRSLTTPDSLNEVLAAGETVATGARLAEFTEHFTDWRDRMYWKRIKVRKLK
ncbi:MAG: hypothetical protein ABJQ29_11545 [Luteolibacter sp.]